MPDEIKMCRMVKGVVEVSWGEEKCFAWVPLDPQPCCENCEHFLTEEGLDSIGWGRCGNEYEIVDYTTYGFFCKYYEAKKQDVKK